MDDENNNTQTKIFTTISSLKKDINNLYRFKEIIGKGSFDIVRAWFKFKEISPHKI